MIRFFNTSILFLVLLLVPVTHGYTQSDSKKTLRILSYNIHHGEGVDGRLDLQRIAKVILSVKPDLVALQEVDVKTSRSNKVDQAKKLAELTKMNFVFGENIQFGGGKYGNCVLSRYEIKNSKNHQLPNHRDGEQRGVLTVVVQPEFLKQPIQFWSTHFDHRRNDSERVASAEFCNQLLESTGESFAFLAGDLNDSIGSKTLDTIDAKWKRSNMSPLPTIPVKKPVRQIDFVCASLNSKVTCIQTKVLSEAVASDHRAVLAVYVFDE